MQHQQPAGGGGGGPQSLGGYGGGAAEERVMSDEDQKLGDLGIAEAASPISSRPPAPRSANFEEMIQATAAEAGGSSSNRWPRQETLALLQIRSEMDTAFRDATLKGPLWDQVSRKLGELGYRRSSKKCKEKFENVHKYYKRTKEGRGGRQDGKSYKFFSQLEALHHTTASAAVLPRYSTNPTTAVSLPPPPPMMMTMPQPEVPVPVPTDYGAALFGNVGISFSSDEDSSSDGEDHDEDEEMETADNRQRKRKRSHGEGEGGDERMMEFFEGLLKQVMQKQEAMQQKFLEAIEKREQDRMIREEAWKRQDMARIAREHDLLAQERAISASRDAAIIDFLQKLTGQTIQLPAAQPPPPPPLPQQQHHHQPRVPSSEPQAMEVVPPEKVVAEAAAETDIMGGGSGGNAEASSSRWPKAEVLALIKLRSGMEAKYQEAGPKGPLWEEISAGMGRMGYKRSSKRCKEKWENINKYFKKVKESNKKRPQDAKTCPYFNELDALYRKKLLGNTTAEAIAAAPSSEVAERKQQEDAGGEAEMQTDLLGGEKQPEDMLNKGHQQIDDNYCNNNIHSDEDEDYEEVDENDDEYDDKTEEDMKMAYKMQFQRQNGGTGTTSSTFVAMVQ